MSLESLKAALTHEATDIEAFAEKLWHSVEGTPAMKALETVTVEMIATPLEAAAATFLPGPLSAPAVALIKQLAAQLEADISAQKPPASPPPSTT